MMLLQLAGLLVYGLIHGLVSAEDGGRAWLRYAPLPHGFQHPGLPTAIHTLDDASDHGPIRTAVDEIRNGVQSIFGHNIEDETIPLDPSRAITIGTLTQYNDLFKPVKVELLEDGFWLNITGSEISILGQNERGALYGAFEYLSLLAQANFTNVAYASNPAAPVRWANQWDNLGGSIERGYGGGSIFFEDGHVKADLTKVQEYARLLASVRINAVIVNNVNADYNILRSNNIDGLGRIADLLRPYGVQVGISICFAAPANLTELDTYDPLDDRVIQFWSDTTDRIYERIPDMAGYLVKANSEEQPGPLTYNRNLAEGANMFARILRPHRGVILFRAFIYTQVDQSDWSADRARQANDYFAPLDGQFDDNVIIQIKYGPLDFQAREPVSPLFANLRNTNVAIEFQITQEYLGQQDHVVYLPTLWKTIADFDLRIDDSSSLTRDVFTGQHFGRRLGGSAGVININTSKTWLGSHLAMSNFYAYGRLAWDWTLSPESILQEWIRLTFGLDETVLSVLTDISMNSWAAYENYTGNLGITTLTDTYTHFGPGPSTHDNNTRGLWTRGDRQGIGIDRTTSNGTAFTSQYPPQVASHFESLSTTPEDLLLWFHHVPWTSTLPSTHETIIQHFYNAHYAGAETASTFLSKFQTLSGKIDEQTYLDILEKFTFQASHAILWRDAICNYYHNLAKIPDISNRVGNHPYRLEAESFTLEGYEIFTPGHPEIASNGTVLLISSKKKKKKKNSLGIAWRAIPFETGKYDIGVQYFDLIDGASNFTLSILSPSSSSPALDSQRDPQPPVSTADQPLLPAHPSEGEQVRFMAIWTADNIDSGSRSHDPSIFVDGNSGTRITFEGIQVRQGDILRIEGVRDGRERAGWDYVVFKPVGSGVVD